jgi:hypothetical protein
MANSRLHLNLSGQGQMIGCSFRETQANPYQMAKKTCPRDRLIPKMAPMGSYPYDNLGYQINSRKSFRNPSDIVIPTCRMTILSAGYSSSNGNEPDWQICPKLRGLQSKFSRLQVACLIVSALQAFSG